jgi:hypothetical protein
MNDDPFFIEGPAVISFSGGRTSCGVNDDLGACTVCTD